jgi:anaerobic selenocysteine-containing dehydrogenase
LINPLTAERKGIRDGDQIWVESAKGNKIKTNVRLSERVHPEVIATLQHRLAKGADFNSLVSLDKETFDFVSCAIDSCILVKAYKA